jgi:hypothetical protein
MKDRIANLATAKFERMRKKGRVGWGGEGNLTTY